MTQAAAAHKDLVDAWRGFARHTNGCELCELVRVGFTRSLYDGYIQPFNEMWVRACPEEGQNLLERWKATVQIALELRSGEDFLARHQGKNSHGKS